MFEIGSSLREARLRQGLDFPELEQATKIRGKYLRALEDEEFSVLPAQTYVKGFLRNYAEYLGLDGQLYVDEFNSRYVVGEDEVLSRPRRSPPPRAPRVQSRIVLLTVLGIAAVALIVIVAWTRGGPGQSTIPGLASQQTTQTAVTRTTHRRLAAWAVLAASAHRLGERSDRLPGNARPGTEAEVRGAPPVDHARPAGERPHRPERARAPASRRRAQDADRHGTRNRAGRLTRPKRYAP